MSETDRNEKPYDEDDLGDDDENVDGLTAAVGAFMIDEWDRWRVPDALVPRHRLVIHAALSPDALEEEVEDSSVTDDASLSFFGCSFCPASGPFMTKCQCEGIFEVPIESGDDDDNEEVEEEQVDEPESYVESIIQGIDDQQQRMALQELAERVQQDIEDERDNYSDSHSDHEELEAAIDDEEWKDTIREVVKEWYFYWKLREKLEPTPQEELDLCDDTNDTVTEEGMYWGMLCGCRMRQNRYPGQYFHLIINKDGIALHRPTDKDHHTFELHPNCREFNTEMVQIELEDGTTDWIPASYVTTAQTETPQEA